jgi:hypothetical protein
MPVDEFFGFKIGHDVAADRSFVNLGHHVVDRLAVAKRFVDRGVEPYRKRSLNWYGHSKKYFRSLKLRLTSGISCRAAVPVGVGHSG